LPRSSGSPKDPSDGQKSGERRRTSIEMDGAAHDLGSVAEVARPGLPAPSPVFLPGVRKAQPRAERVRALLVTVQEIAERRAALLTQLRHACRADDAEQIVRVARLLVGLDGG
jgi:hypothetical protein